MLICSLLSLMGCAVTVAEKKTNIVQRQGTVVTTLEETQEVKVLAPDKDGNLVPGTVKIPVGSLVQLGNPPAPVVKPTEKPK